MVKFLICFLINVFDLCIYKKYLDEVAGKKEIGSLFAVMYFVLGSVVLSIINLEGIPVLNLLSTIIVLAIYISRYLCEWKTKIVVISLFLGIGFIVEPIGYLLFSLLVGDSNKATMESYLIIIFVEVMRAVIIEIFCKLKYGKIVKADRLPNEIIWILLAIPALSVVSCCFVIRIAAMCISAELIALCIVIILSIILSDYFMIYMVERYVFLMERRHIDAMYQQEMELKEDFYREVQESYEYVQTLKHDLKNQLISLYDIFLDEGGSEAGNKIKGLYFELKDDDNRIYTANPVLNSILKNKFSKAREHGIEVSSKLHIPKKLNIDCGDMGILYGNILDNAIEACQKIDGEERYIHLESKYSEGMLLLVVKNSKVSVVNIKLETTKANAKHHGRGIFSVRAVVEKYNGTAVFLDQTDHFITKAILYGIQAIE